MGCSKKSGIKNPKILFPKKMLYCFFFLFDNAQYLREIAKLDCKLNCKTIQGWTG